MTSYTFTKEELECLARTMAGLKATSKLNGGCMECKYPCYVYGDDGNVHFPRQDDIFHCLESQCHVNIKKVWSLIDHEESITYGPDGEILSYVQQVDTLLENNSRN